MHHSIGLIEAARQASHGPPSTNRGRTRTSPITHRRLGPDSARRRPQARQREGQASSKRRNAKAREKGIFQPLPPRAPPAPFVVGFGPDQRPRSTDPWVAWSWSLRPVRCIPLNNRFRRGFHHRRTQPPQPTPNSPPAKEQAGSERPAVAPPSFFLRAARRAAGGDGGQIYLFPSLGPVPCLSPPSLDRLASSVVADRLGTDEDDAGRPQHIPCVCARVVLAAQEQHSSFVAQNVISWYLQPRSPRLAPRSQHGYCRSYPPPPPPTGATAQGRSPRFPQSTPRAPAAQGN